MKWHGVTWYDNPAMKILTVTILILCTIQRGSSETLHVGSGKQYTTITSALTATHDGDSVIVHGGTYKEGNIVVATSIALIGLNWPVLDGQHKYEVVSIKANRVLFTGFKVQYSGYASLKIRVASKCMIVNMSTSSTMHYWTIFWDLSSVQ